MIDGNKLGTVGFEKLGTPYKEMDCQAFIEWCLAKCGLKKDLAGSNAWYREVMKNGAVFTPEECVRQLGCVPKGAFLFIWANDGGEEKRGYHDGLGNASHIGICTMPKGEGAIHSSASRGCVAESYFAGKTIKNGGWNRVGLWTKEVAYDYGSGTVDPEPAPVEPEPAPEPAPETGTAIVWADNGKPVNLRKTASMMGRLIDRVPCGETVELLEPGTQWSKIRWKGKTGWMMTKFLETEDDGLYTVTIEHLTNEEAEEIVKKYGGTKEKEKKM